TIAAAPASLSFSFQSGGSTPASQTIGVTSSGAAALSLTAGATVQSGSGWLSLSPVSATTPLNLTVSVTPGSLSPGTYNGTGTIPITAAGATNSPLTVAVQLVVTVAPPSPMIAAIQNASSFLSTAVSPGELITLFAAPGTAIGPATGVSLRITGSQVDTTLGD